MAMNRRVLQKFPGFGASIEFLFGQEPVVFAFDFACPRGPGRARGRVNEFRCLSQGIDERRFAGTGWRGKDEQNSVTAEAATQDFEFVRGFFPTPLCKRRHAAKSQHRSPWLRAYSVREKFPE